MNVIWNLYFGNGSPIIKVLIKYLGVDYQFIIRWLSTTSVLQGNRWLISDDASPYNITGAAKLESEGM